MRDEQNIDGEYSNTLMLMLYTTDPKYTLIQDWNTSPHLVETSEQSTDQNFNPI